MIGHRPERAVHLGRALAVQGHHRPAHEGVHTGRRPVDRTRIGRGHVGGLPAVDDPVVQWRPGDADQVGALDIRAGQRPNQLRRNEKPAGRIGGRQVLQIHPGPAVAAAHPRLTAIGAGDRPAQLQRRPQQIAHRIGHFGPRAGEELVDQFGSQQVGVRRRHVPRVGHDGLAGGVDEVERVALVDRLEFLPVQENPVGQPVDAPAVRGLGEFDGPGVGKLAVPGLEDADVGERPEDLGLHGHRNLFRRTGFGEHDLVQEQGAALIVPVLGGRIGEKLPGRLVPVGRIGGGFEEFPQHLFRAHPGSGFGQLLGRRPLDGPDRLRRRGVGHAGTSGQ